MAGARNMEKPTALFLESYLPVVQETRDESKMVIGQQLCDRYPAIFCPSCRPSPRAGAICSSSDKVSA